MQFGLVLLLLSLLKTDYQMVEPLPNSPGRYQILGRVMRFSDSTQPPMIEVISLIDNGRLTDVEGYDSQDPAKNQVEISSDSLVSFYDQHIKGRLFYLSSEGAMVGTARTTGPHIDSELSDRLVGAYANITSTSNHELLVTSWQPKPAVKPKVASVNQKRVVLERGKKLLNAKSIPASIESRLEVEQCMVIDGNGLLACVVHAIDTSTYTDYGVFFITDMKTTSIYYVKYGIGGEASSQNTSYLGQMDLDNDGVDEIILQNSYYESMDYTVLKRQNEKWASIFEGGGNGL